MKRKTKEGDKEGNKNPGGNLVRRFETAKVLQNYSQSEGDAIESKQVGVLGKKNCFAWQ